ncbi:MAG: hybrid sensor histidine kinase/response regulator [Phenylobacterium sp.]|nr:MAG: hybrid sensor histidine kinase/response regulator [Phenylobacterium sp.]
MASEDSTLGGEVTPWARILIVDDIADNRILLARRFSKRGVEIAEAESGQGALEAIEREAFDVVLLDVMMPDMNGLEVLKRIRANHSQAELPVIMVTGKAESQDMVEALTAGANDYITKPVDFAVALVRVSAQAARRRAEEEARLAREQLSRANEDLERRIAERTAELVRTNEQLREANKAKDEFLAIVSHELRTPLNGMIATGQILASTPLAANQTRLVDIINGSAGQLFGIVGDLLDMLDLTAGGVTLSPAPARLDEIVQEAAAAAQPKAAAKGLTFRLDMAAIAKIGEITVDRRRLVDILARLLDNAVKFTDQGEVRLGVVQRGDRVAIEVTDTGVGLNTEQAARLFRPFEQADSSLTRKFGGLGLGLAITHGLVGLMGGEITAQGCPGGGAVFCVELPKAAVAIAA